MFLLDTNIVSELNKPRPAPEVTGWIRSAQQHDLFFSVVSIAEIVKGITSHPDPVRQSALQIWLDQFVRPWLYGRILPIPEEIAEIAGRFEGLRAAAGRPMAFADALIAATAVKNGFTLVTRNVRDFVEIPVTLINPWK
ncbi:MAG: type II toxin-antitoxin system VapC family toxin [Acidobacteriota bacterium]